MDLGIRGRHAIVCGASEGLGRACAEALAADGVQLVICARREGPLEKAAGEIREAHGVSVEAIACDITTEAGRTAVLAASDETDILVNNAGGPPPGNFREWDRDQWIAALDANMLSPIEMIKALIDGMIERRFGRIINITSGSVKSPIPELGLSNGARAGLTGFVAGLARQVAKHNVTINGLLPGEFATARLYKLSQARAEGTAKTAEEILAERAQRNPAGRQGDPTEFGAACAFLCSAHAGYITGQNILMDGGSFNSSIQALTHKEKYGAGVIAYRAQTNLIITLNSPHILLISKRLAEQGYAWAQVNLGYIYAHGEGVPEDYVKSYAWHSVSAALGAEDAKTS